MAFHRQDKMQTVAVNTQAEALRFMRELDAISTPGTAGHKSTSNTADQRKKKKKKKKKASRNQRYP